MTPTLTAAARVSGTIKALADVLEWYGEQARLARLIHKEGDAGRHALANDGGRKAREVLAAIQPEPEPQPVEGRATNMPLTDMARAEAYRSLSRCLRDPKEIKKLGLAKDPTLLDVLAWHDRRIAQLDATPPSAGTVSVEAAAKATLAEIERQFAALGVTPENMAPEMVLKRLRALAGENS